MLDTSQQLPVSIYVDISIVEMVDEARRHRNRLQSRSHALLSSCCSDQGARTSARLERTAKDKVNGSTTREEGDGQRSSAERTVSDA